MRRPISGIIVLSIVAFLGTLACRRGNETEAVRATGHFLSVSDTVLASKAQAVVSIERAKSPVAIYFVTLAGTPKAKVLALECRWRDPRGTMAHENSFETHEIDHSPWTTHCRNRFGRESPPGRWNVSMWLDGHILSSQDFEVR